SGFRVPRPFDELTAPTETPRSLHLAPTTNYLSPSRRRARPKCPKCLVSTVPGSGLSSYIPSSRVATPTQIGGGRAVILPQTSPGLVTIERLPRVVASAQMGRASL